MNQAEVFDGVEMHEVAGKLFLTSVEEPDKQVALSAAAIEGLMGYLTAMGAIGGWVQYSEKGIGGAHIYRLTIEDREHPKKSEAMGMVVEEASVLLVETTEYFEKAAQSLPSSR